MILRSGATVGKYRLDFPLTIGGSGSIWSARHIKLGKPVAVKFLSPALAGSKGSLARFKREAHTAAAIQSCHVVRVQDFGVESDTPYLVMELLHGEDLGARLSRVKRLTLEQAAVILVHVAKGLCHAHEAGVVHRDIKPNNLFLAVIDDEEMVKILDFGIAKGPDTPVVEQIDLGTMIGSPSYVSPEQATGDGSMDHRSDLWSMAVVLYQMVTGTLPFCGPTVGCVLKKVFMEPPPRMAEVAPDLPPELDAFFDKALAKRPSERFASIEEMTHAFLAIAAPHLESPLSSLKAIRERGIPHVADAVPGGIVVDKPHSTEAKTTLGGSRGRRARPWRLVAATPAAAVALIFPVSMDTVPDVRPAVVVTAEAPPCLPGTVVPSPSAPTSPGAEQSAAAPRETTPTSPRPGDGEASPARPAGTQKAAHAPPVVRTASPRTDPRPGNAPPGPDACQVRPGHSGAAPVVGFDKRWF